MGGAGRIEVAKLFKENARGFIVQGLLWHVDHMCVAVLIVLVFGLVCVVARRNSNANTIASQRS